MILQLGKTNQTYLHHDIVIIYINTTPQRCRLAQRHISSVLVWQTFGNMASINDACLLYRERNHFSTKPRQFDVSEAIFQQNAKQNTWPNATFLEYMGVTINTMLN